MGMHPIKDVGSHLEAGVLLDERRKLR
jgi:hypothetical protein